MKKPKPTCTTTLFLDENAAIVGATTGQGKRRIDDQELIAAQQWDDGTVRMTKTDWDKLIKAIRNNHTIHSNPHPQANNRFEPLRNIT